MIPGDEKDLNVSIRKLAQDNEYYINVFKKTERIVSLCFYILSFVSKEGHAGVHTQAITERALSLYDTSLLSLSWSEPGLKDRLLLVQTKLVGLAGTVRIAAAGRVLTEELDGVLQAELDLVIRYLKNHYLTGESLSAGVGVVVRKEVRSAVPKAPRVNVRVNIPKGDISSDAHLVYSQLTDRSERIKTVLEAKPEATIKDIAEVITDVSEKTIQRELTSLIEKGQVMRQGERRWSKYSIIKV